MLASTLPADIQWAADTFCNGQLALDGLTILGIPLGNPTYVRQHLTRFTHDFANTTQLLHDRVPNPASKLRLFTQCVQAQVPFRQFADAMLSNTSSLTLLPHTGQRSKALSTSGPLSTEHLHLCRFNLPSIAISGLPHQPTFLRSCPPTKTSPPHHAYPQKMSL